MPCQVEEMKEEVGEDSENHRHDNRNGEGKDEGNRGLGHSTGCLRGFPEEGGIDDGKEVGGVEDGAGQQDEEKKDFVA